MWCHMVFLIAIPWVFCTYGLFLLLFELLLFLNKGFSFAAKTCLSVRGGCSTWSTHRADQWRCLLNALARGYRFAISQSSASAHHFCIGCGTGAISGHLPSLYLERDTDRLGSVSVSFTWHVGHVSHTRNTDKQITFGPVSITCTVNPGHRYEPS